MDPASAALLDQEDRATNDARELEALQRLLRKFGNGAAGDLKVDGVAELKTETPLRMRPRKEED